MEKTSEEDQFMLTWRTKSLEEATEENGRAIQGTQDLVLAQDPVQDQRKEGKNY